MGCNMSLKLHFLHFRTDSPSPPENMGVMSSEYGESFHQDISQMEKMYGGKWSSQYVGVL
jgi:hypothetical protein